MRPCVVNKTNEYEIPKFAYNYLKIAPSSKLEVGNIVRTGKKKHVFNKGYTPNCSTDLFKIVKIHLGKSKGFTKSRLILQDWITKNYQSWHILSGTFNRKAKIQKKIATEKPLACVEWGNLDLKKFFRTLKKMVSHPVIFYINFCINWELLLLM